MSEIILRGCKPPPSPPQKKEYKNFHECEIWLEKPITIITVCHHEPCREMPDNDSESWIFLSVPNSHDRFLILHTFQFPTTDFRLRIDVLVKIFFFNFLLVSQGLQNDVKEMLQVVETDVNKTDFDITFPYTSQSQGNFHGVCKKRISCISDKLFRDFHPFWIFPSCTRGCKTTLCMTSGRR